MNYKIVSDSSANIYEYEKAWHVNVPLKIINGDKEFVDQPGMNLMEMIETLKTTKLRSSTSCPNMQDYLDAFEGADIVYVVTITSNLSGSYASAMQAKQEYEQIHAGSRVHVFDSFSAGGELKLIVDKIYECAQAGQSFDEVVANVSEYQKTSHTLFSLESLNNLARNGRVNSAVAAAAGVLGIRVVGKATEGTLQQLYKCRGEKKALDTIWKEMKFRGYCGGKVCIAECLIPEAAKSLADRIRAEFPDSAIEIMPCTGLCTFYAETGGLIIGYEGGTNK